MQHFPLPQNYQEHWQFDRFAYAPPHSSTAEEWPACQLDIFEHQDWGDPYYTVVATQLHDYRGLSITNGYEAFHPCRQACAEGARRCGDPLD